MEIAAASQDQGLLDGILQAVVGVLGDAVFMALGAIGAGSGGGIVGAHHLGNAAQGPQRILHSLLQRQEGLAGGDLDVAPA